MYVCLNRSIFTLIISLIATPLFSQHSGNYCLFNGEDSWIEVIDNNTLDFNNQVTIDAWIYLCDLNDHYMIVSKNHCYGNRLSYYFSVNRGKLIWRWSDNGVCTGGNEFSTYDNVVKKNTWTHVAVSVSSSSIEMFVNGNAVDGRLTSGYYSSIFITNVPLKIGVYQKINSDHGNFFPGKMDNLRIWNKKLSGAEINNIYNNQIEGLQNNLVLYMDMDDVSSNIVHNKSNMGNINDGAIVGNPWFINKFEFEIGSDTSACEGNPIHINIDHHQDAGILWNTGHTSFNYTISSEGSYWAKYSLGKCDLYDTLKVDFVHLFNDLIPDTVLCNNDFVRIEVPEEYKIFSWYDNTTNTYKDIATSGSYWINSYEDQCYTIDSFKVVQKAIPKIELGNDISVCSDEVVTITVKSATENFTWNDGKEAVVRVISSSGNYWVKSENECGSSIDSISVYIQQKVNPDLLKDTIVCQERIILGVPNPYKPNFQWYDNTQAGQHEITQSGSYWIQFKDELCIIRDYINVSFLEMPSVALREEELLLCKNEVYQLQLDPIVNGEFFWSDSTRELNRTISEAGTYIISVRNECGVAKDTLEVEIKNLGEVFIPNVITSNEDGLNDRLILDPKFTNVELDIYNRYGRLVFRSQDYNNDFSGENISSGMYYYLLKDGCTKDEFKGWLHVIR